jgi:hypothetical protein
MSLSTLLQSFTVPGAVLSSAAWKGLPIGHSNSAKLNRSVVPMLSMQAAGYDVGCAQDLAAIRKRIAIAQLMDNIVIQYFPWKKSSNGHLVLSQCTKCANAIDFVSFDDLCPCSVKMSL